MKNTVIFVDHENLRISAQNRGVSIDWFRFKDYLANDKECRYPMEAFCYVAIDPRKEHARDEEIRQLWEDGWLVKSKVGSSAGEGNYKCNVDVEMAMDMISFAYEVKPDILVLVSGDQDFAPVVIKLRERGIRVEVAAFPETISRVLLDAASGYINLDKWMKEEDAFIPVTKWPDQEDALSEEEGLDDPDFPQKEVMEAMPQESREIPQGGMYNEPMRSRKVIWDSPWE